MISSVGMIVEVISHILFEAGLAEIIITRAQSYLFSIARFNIRYIRIADGTRIRFYSLFFELYYLIRCLSLDRLLNNLIFMHFLHSIEVSSMYFPNMPIWYLLFVVLPD